MLGTEKYEQFAFHPINFLSLVICYVVGTCSMPLRRLVPINNNDHNNSNNSNDNIN